MLPVALRAHGLATYVPVRLRATEDALLFRACGLAVGSASAAAIKNRDNAWDIIGWAQGIFSPILVQKAKEAPQYRGLLLKLNLVELEDARPRSVELAGKRTRALAEICAAFIEDHDESLGAVIKVERMDRLVECVRMLPLGTWADCFRCPLELCGVAGIHAVVNIVLVAVDSVHDKSPAYKLAIFFKDDFVTH